MVRRFDPACAAGNRAPSFGGACAGNVVDTVTGLAFVVTTAYSRLRKQRTSYIVYYESYLHYIRNVKYLTELGTGTFHTFTYAAATGGIIEKFQGCPRQPVIPSRKKNRRTNHPMRTEFSIKGCPRASNNPNDSELAGPTTANGPRAASREGKPSHLPCLEEIRLAHTTTGLVVDPEAHDVPHRDDVSPTRLLVTCWPSPCVRIATCLCDARRGTDSRSALRTCYGFPSPCRSS